MPILRGDIAAGLASLANFGMKFGAIYADPPWNYVNRSTRNAVNYDSMSVEKLAALPVTQVTMDRAHLHLWTTNAFLFDAKLILEAWGFTYKGVFVWVKPEMGMGNYWRVSHEFMLLGVKGGLRFTDRSLISWFKAKRTKHSIKPAAIRSLIQRASPPPYLELFAREFTGTEDWWALGNEVREIDIVPQLL